MAVKESPLGKFLDHLAANDGDLKTFRDGPLHRRLQMALDHGLSSDRAAIVAAPWNAAAVAQALSEDEGVPYDVVPDDSHYEQCREKE